MCYAMLKPLLSSLDAERAHALALKTLSMPFFHRWIQPAPYAGKPVNLFGRSFPNPIGLAAGFDKDAVAVDACLKAGFGFVEVGTVTPRAQAGNPKPRLFRVPKALAVINRMGFNNGGVAMLLENLKARRVSGIVGVNIGKNRGTPLADASNDYIEAFEAVYPEADYVTVNISSPNTPELRRLQTPEYLTQLLEQLQERRQALQDQHQRDVPLLVKISPDLSSSELEALVRILIGQHVDGVIATNTTLDHRALKSCLNREEAGGMSGAPLAEIALASQLELSSLLDGAMPIVAVGGIMTAEDVRLRLEMGASLVQLYTGLVYRGPGLLREGLAALSASAMTA